jgi:hypothetical protein
LVFGFASIDLPGAFAYLFFIEVEGYFPVRKGFVFDLIGRGSDIVIANGYPGRAWLDGKPVFIIIKTEVVFPVGRAVTVAVCYFIKMVLTFLHVFHGSRIPVALF